jgi:hypothetical protein
MPLANTPPLTLAIVHTEEDWCAVDQAWRLDMDPSDWQADWLRLNLRGATELRWHSPAGSGVAYASAQGVVRASIALPQNALLTLTTPASTLAPTLLWGQALTLSRHGVSTQLLPSCGQKAATRAPAPATRALSSQALIDLAAVSDSALMEAAAKSLLADDSDANTLAILRVLARVARNRTPDGLIDLMTHIGSGKGSTSP